MGGLRTTQTTVWAPFFGIFFFEFGAVVVIIAKLQAQLVDKPRHLTAEWNLWMIALGLNFLKTWFFVALERISESGDFSKSWKKRPKRRHLEVSDFTENFFVAFLANLQHFCFFPKKFENHHSKVTSVWSFEPISWISRVTVQLM